MRKDAWMVWTAPAIDAGKVHCRSKDVARWPRRCPHEANLPYRTRHSAPDRSATKESHDGRSSTRGRRRGPGSFRTYGRSALPRRRCRGVRPPADPATLTVIVASSHLRDVRVGAGRDPVDADPAPLSMTHRDDRIDARGIADCDGIGDGRGSERPGPPPGTPSDPRPR